VSYCCLKLAAEVEDVREPRGRRKSAIGSRYRTTTTEDVTVDTSVHV
jgi:hypothetical protein